MLHVKSISCHVPDHAFCLRSARGSLPAPGDTSCTPSASSWGGGGEQEEGELLIQCHETACGSQLLKMESKPGPEAGVQAGGPGERSKVDCGAGEFGQWCR